MSRRVIPLFLRGRVPRITAHAGGGPHGSGYGRCRRRFETGSLSQRLRPQVATAHE